MARRKTEISSTTADDMVDVAITGEDSLGLDHPIAGEEMARESGITREPPRSKKVTWSGPGRIGIAGYGDLQPGQSINLPAAVANDLARAPGFSKED